MAIKWSAIACQEVHNTRREWMDSDGRFRASVKLMCHFEDRYKLIQDLYTCTWGPILPVSTIGYNPRAYPNDSQTRVAGGSGTPGSSPVMSFIGVDSAIIGTAPEAFTAFDSAEQVIDYRSMSYIDVQYGRMYNIEDSIEFDTEAVKQSYKQFKWKEPATDQYDIQLLGELEGPVAVLHSAILVRDFVGLSPGGEQATVSPNFSTLLECVNFTNSQPYVSQQLKRTFKAGTLLMLEPEIRPSLNMQEATFNSNKFGQFGFAVRVKFRYKPGYISPVGKTGSSIDRSVDTHNLFWRSRLKTGSGSRGGWDKLVVMDPASSQYEDFEPFKRKAEIDANWLKAAEIPAAAQ